jgi:hypothetical protein
MRQLFDAQEHVGHRNLYLAGTRHDLCPVAWMVHMQLQSICVKHVRVIYVECIVQKATLEKTGQCGGRVYVKCSR